MNQHIGGLEFSEDDESRFNFYNDLTYYSRSEILKLNNDSPIVRTGYTKFAEGHTFSWIPFQFNREGFIVKFENNKYYMMAIDGEPVTGEDERFLYKRSYQLCKHKFCVLARVDSNEFQTYNFDKPLVALSVAYKFNGKLFARRTRIKNWFLYHFDFSVDRHYKILEPVVNLIADREYNTNYTDNVEPANERSVINYSEEYPSTQVADEELYQWFKVNMLNTLKQKGEVPHKWGSKSNCVGSLETLPGEELLLRTSKRNVDFAYASHCVDVNGFPAVVTRFPKSGAFTSSGKVRDIFPMNILYENALRRYFKNRKASVPHRVISGVDFGKPMSNFYDVKSCDRTLLPYLARFAKENGTEWMIPRVVDSEKHKFRSYYADVFPSGVYHTTIVTTCFTSALCTVMGLDDAEIQGDGIKTNKVPTKLKHLIRTATDFNGFRYMDGRWRYVRTDRLREFKYIRGNGPKGHMRYVITRWAYEVLGGDCGTDLAIRCKGRNGNAAESGTCGTCGQLTYYGLHLHQMDNDLEKAIFIGTLYSDPGCIVKKAMNHVGHCTDTRGNNWDMHPLKQVQGVRDRGSNLYLRHFVDFSEN